MLPGCAAPLLPFQPQSDMPRAKSGKISTVGTPHPTAAARVERRGARLAADTASALVLVAGLVVLAGWLSHSRRLVQMAPGQVPMQFNTAVALLAAGLTPPLLRTRWRAAAVLTAGVAFGIGAVTALQYALDRSLGIDTLLYDPWLVVGGTTPGRMARNTALCFAALGACGLLLPVARRLRGAPVAIGVTASAVAALALVALFGYAAGVSEAYTWRTSTAIAPTTAAALCVLSLGYGAAAWCATQERGAPRWLPVPVAVGTLAVTLFLWQALTASDEVLTLGRAAGVIVGIGVVLAVLLGVATAAAQAAARRRRELEARHERDVVLQDAYAAVARVDDLAAGFARFAEAVRAAVAFDRMSLTLLDGDVATVAATAGASAEEVADGASVTTPVLIGGSVRATLTVASAREGAYDDDDVALIGELAVLTGGALYTLARLDDERVTTARLRELDELKNEFVGVVAHDLRSPMTVIAGYVDTMLQRWDLIDDAMKQDLLRVVSRNTRRLSTMVEDVLQVARIESGDFPYEIKPFDIVPLVERTVAEMNAATPGKLVRAEVPAAVPKAVGDEDRYWRVLTNLLSNAQKFSPADAEVVVTVTATRREIEVSVTDRGPGIPEEHLPRLFGKFSRLAGPPDGQKGTGLGLYICKALVEAQGGRISARSRVGEGTTVTFTIPTGESR